MNENRLQRIDIYVIAFALILAGYFVWNATNVLGSAPSGLEATEARAQTITVGTSAPTTLFATSTGCASRVVTTVSQPIKILFSGVNIATSSMGLTTGHFQAASTTIVYDSGLYGCGVMTALGYGGSTDFAGSTSSSTLTISEFR